MHAHLDFVAHDKLLLLRYMEREEVEVDALRQWITGFAMEAVSATSASCITINDMTSKDDQLVLGKDNSTRTTRPIPAGA